MANTSYEGRVEEGSIHKDTGGGIKLNNMYI